MNPSRRRAVVVAGLMAASFAGAAAWRPTTKMADQRPKVDLEKIFPKAFGDWRVDDRIPVQLVSPDTQAVLDKIYNQTLSRTYVGPRGERIMLSVAYGGDQSDGTRAHRPEVCYPAQGFQVAAMRKSEIDASVRVLPVRQLVATLGGRIEPITYWTVVGERIALTGTEQKLAQLAYSVRGFIPDGLLVRVSNIAPAGEAAFALHQAFIAQLALALSRDDRPFVVGRADAGGPADRP